MEYYPTLPPEARLQLLIEADIGTVLELCNDPLFKNICSNQLLWERRLKKEFDKSSDSPKQEYFQLSGYKIQEEAGKTKKEISEINTKILNSKENEKLERKQKEEIKKLKAKHKKEIEILEKELGKEYKLEEKQKLLRQQDSILNKLNQEANNVVYINKGKGYRLDVLRRNFGKFGKVTITPEGNKIRVEYADSRDLQDAISELEDLYDFILP